ncbi:uncharacterized protein [Clytia hemisphaerica]|uniref:Uncharacterized protein n=1 Tax=Clytia hemisphaerica TaxID=252671 RepID=A0A7M5UZT9_9CNID
MATASSPTVSSPASHEHQHQLFAICSIGQYALQQLLKYFTYNPNSGITPEQSLSQIFTNRKRTIKDKCKNIFRNQGLINIIYTNVGNDIFQPSINISKFDISTLNDVFRHVEDFETSNVNRRTGWTCKDPNHVSGGNNKRVCCQKCWTCLDCVLKAHGTPTWQELFEKGIIVKPVNPNFVCPMLLVRLSIDIIGLFRNITMHLTETKCNEMDFNLFNDPEVPNFTSWSKIKEALCFAVENILAYLESFGYLSPGDKQRHVEAIRLMGTSFDLSIYGNAAEQFLLLESHTAATEQLNLIQALLKEIKSSIKGLTNLKVEMRVSFEKDIDFHLHSPEAISINAAFKHASEVHFAGLKIETDMLSAKPVVKTAFEEEKVVVIFKITSAVVSFKDYKNFLTDQSAKLWAEIEKTFEEFLPDAAVRLNSWEVGSIIIKMSLSKKNQKAWSKSDRFEISCLLPKITEKLQIFMPQTQCHGEIFNDYSPERKLQTNMHDIIFSVHTTSVSIAEPFKNFNKQIMLQHFQKELQVRNFTSVEVLKELHIPRKEDQKTDHLQNEIENLTKLICELIEKRMEIKDTFGKEMESLAKKLDITTGSQVLGAAATVIGGLGVIGASSSAVAIGSAAGLAGSGTVAAVAAVAGGSAAGAACAAGGSIAIGFLTGFLFAPPLAFASLVGGLMVFGAGSYAKSGLTTRSMVTKGYEKIEGEVLKSLQEIEKHINTTLRSFNMEDNWSGVIINILTGTVLKLARVSVIIGDQKNEVPIYRIGNQTYRVIPSPISSIPDKTEDDWWKDLANEVKSAKAKAIREWLNEDLPSQKEIKDIFGSLQRILERFVQGIKEGNCGQLEELKVELEQLSLEVTKDDVVGENTLTRADSGYLSSEAFTGTFAE